MDASAAWCVMIGSTTALTAAYIPEDAASELFPADRSAIHAGVFAPMGKATPDGDGYQVTGRWQWGSGSPNAQYIWGGSVILKDGKPERMPNGLPRSRMMMFNKADVNMLDTWDVSGLCGTGSTDFSVENIYTPHAHLRRSRLRYAPLIARSTNFPFFGLLATGVCSVSLGIARAAINELISFADAKTPPGHAKEPSKQTRSANLSIPR